MIVITFIGRRISDKIWLNIVNFEFEPYNHPVIQCFECSRFLPASKECKASQRCQICVLEYEEKEIYLLKKHCVLCNITEYGSTYCPA